jgi:hypothetical protein
VDEGKDLNSNQSDDLNSSLTAAIGRLNTTFKKYVISNDKLSKRLLFLNIVLTVATVVGAVATLLAFLKDS